VSKNIVKLRIYLVVNVSKIERYREPIKRKRMEEPKPVKVEE